ncbi:MAG: CRISPR-associated endonuclease Cas2 [Clostridia bacterium]|nr:CRISPR-associated endonuclease Cas2 [Clostridia bacterium]
MRLLVFFDLPTESASDRREYARFRKALIKNGFMMMQKSVYCKLALTQSGVETALEAVRRSKPPKGVIQSLIITEKQYSRMEFILGTHKGDILDSDERFVEL